MHLKGRSSQNVASITWETVWRTFPLVSTFLKRQQKWLRHSLKSAMLWRLCMIEGLTWSQSQEVVMPYHLTRLLSTLPFCVFGSLDLSTPWQLVLVSPEATMMMSFKEYPECFVLLKDGSPNKWRAIRPPTEFAVCWSNHTTFLFLLFGILINQAHTLLFHFTLDGWAGTPLSQLFVYKQLKVNIYCMPPLINFTLLLSYFGFHFTAIIWTELLGN